MFEDDNGFHERLDVAFRASGISQAELGRRVGASPATVSDWFHKEPRAYPKGESMLALPRALGVSGQWLFWNEGPMTVREAEGAVEEPNVSAIDTATAQIVEAAAVIRRAIGLPAISPDVAAEAGAERMLQDFRDAGLLPGDDEHPGEEERRRTPA